MGRESKNHGSRKNKEVHHTERCVCKIAEDDHNSLVHAPIILQWTESGNSTRSSSKWIYVAAWWWQSYTTFRVFASELVLSKKFLLLGIQRCGKWNTICKNNDSCWSTLKVLKTRFLALHNRPGLDFVAHVFNIQFILKYVEDHNLYSTGRKKGTWWRDFSKNGRHYLSGRQHQRTAHLHRNGGAPVLGFELIRISCANICAENCHAFHTEIYIVRGFRHFTNSIMKTGVPILYSKRRKKRILLYVMNCQLQKIQYERRSNFATETDKQDKETLLILQWMLSHVEKLQSTPDRERQ